MNNTITPTDSTLRPAGPLYEILEAIRSFLEFAMKEEISDSHLNVVLNSVKREKGTEEEDVVITLLRIEEETSRKSQSTYYREDWDEQNPGKSRVYPTSPDIDINLEILISSHAGKYEYALSQISTVIRLLNSIKTAIMPKGMNEADFSTLRSLSISMMPMSFDQHLSMWQTLGGELVPSVAYKVRMITLAGIPVKKAGPLIYMQPTVVETGDMDSRKKPLVGLSEEPAPEPESKPEPEPDPEDHPLGTWTIREL